MLTADIRAIYRSAWAFMLACPILFAIPVIVEFAQHVVELQAGMYVDEAGAKVAEADPLRLQFGFAKVLALMLPGYWLVRFIMLGGAARRAAAPEWPALPLWLAIFVLFAGHNAFSLFGPSLPEIVGLTGQAATIATVAIMVITQVVMAYLSAWLVAWPVGNARIGPLKSAAIMQGSIWYTLILAMAGVIPLMVLHYALAIVAVVAAPGWADWLLMAFDSWVVGLLALTMASATTFAARHAACKSGIDLLDSPAPTVTVAS